MRGGASISHCAQPGILKISSADSWVTAMVPTRDRPVQARETFIELQLHLGQDSDGELKTRVGGKGSRELGISLPATTTADDRKNLTVKMGVDRWMIMEASLEALHQKFMRGFVLPSSQTSSNHISSGGRLYDLPISHQLLSRCNTLHNSVTSSRAKSRS